MSSERAETTGNEVQAERAKRASDNASMPALEGAVSSNWRDPISISAGELELIERWFGDELDDLLGPEASRSRAAAAE